MPLNSLPNWQQQNWQTLWHAYALSCQQACQNKTQSIYLFNKQISAIPWIKICQDALAKSTEITPAMIQQFIVDHFKAYAITQTGISPRFTGYYLYSAPASITKQAPYTSPVYALPKDLITVPLAKFFNGKKVTKNARNELYGRLKKGELIPYYTRKEINEYGLKDAEVLAWMKPVDRFFMQIQGSGILQFSDDKQMLLGYASQNGQDYYAIGRYFLKNGLITRENMSIQRIKTWLTTHPQQQQKILNLDASFVFFKQLNTSAPLGTHKVPLTSFSSIAIDQKYIPLGSVVWISLDENNPMAPHGWVAQDTGGAIKGSLRADLYLGHGDKAKSIAGSLNTGGQMWLLIPKSIDVNQLLKKG